MRAYAITSAHPSPEDLPSGPARIAETPRLALVLYAQVGILAIQSRRPRTGGVVLDPAGLSDEALEILRAFAGVGGG